MNAQSATQKTMNRYEAKQLAELERTNKKLRQARAAEFTELQMGLLTALERAPNEIPVNSGMGYPRDVADSITEALAPLLMTGLVHMTADRKLELSEEGQALLTTAREGIKQRQQQGIRTSEGASPDAESLHSRE